MSDEVDDANDRIEREIENTLHANRLQKPEAFYCGVCLSCNQAVDYPRRWCNADCRNHWSLNERNRIGK